MMLSKMISIHDCGEDPTKEDIQILLESLKPGMKLPLLNDYNHKDCYIEQLIASGILSKWIVGRLHAELRDN